MTNKEKKNYEKNSKIIDDHLKIVENQKNQYNMLKSQLNSNACILILDFKENFKLSTAGDDVTHDFYNKRQVSCLGAALTFRHNEQEYTHYAAYLSSILNHDSLYSSDVLENVIKKFKDNFKFVNLFTDCGPHFRSKEFLHKIQQLSSLYKINISLNFFAEYHGKNIVDGFFWKTHQNILRYSIYN